MTLAALLPELAADIQEALVRIGRGDLADQVRSAPLSGHTRDDFAGTVVLEVQPADPGRPPGELVSLRDEIGVGLELDAAGRLARIDVVGYEEMLARFDDLRARRALFSGEGFRAVEMFAFDAPRLQAFFEANAAYFLALSGAPAGPREAEECLASRPPDGWRHQRKWMLFFVDADGAVIGMADLLAGLFAPAVWHLGLFVAATPLHGGGMPHAMYAGLEAWVRSRGARWVRLGVVERNVRAARFWQRVGFTEVRVRPDYEVGGGRHRLHVLAKPLGAPDWEWYRRNVPRDDPQAP